MPLGRRSVGMLASGIPESFVQRIVYWKHGTEVRNCEHVGDCGCERGKRKAAVARFELFTDYEDAP